MRAPVSPAAKASSFVAASSAVVAISASGAAGGGLIDLGDNTLDIPAGAQIANLVTVADGAQLSSSTGGGTLTAAQALTLAAGPGTLKLSGTSSSVLTVARSLGGDARAGQVVDAAAAQVAA